MSHRLHWACGPAIAPGWVNSDRDDLGQDHVGDIRAGLPWSADFDYAASHHGLQMLSWDELVPALAELRRVLRPGGTLRISVPDLLRAFAAWHENDASHFVIPDRMEPGIDGKLCVYLSQAGSTRSLFTTTWLVELCERAGFAHVVVSAYRGTHSRWPDIVDLDTRPAESIFVEATR